MPARDRHRRAQLVRDVVEEALLLRQQLGALGSLAPAAPAPRPAAGARARPSPGTSPTSAAPRTARPRAVRRRRRRSGSARPSPGSPAPSTRPVVSGRPDPEAVDQRQADPDEVERDRLPARARAPSRPGSPRANASHASSTRLCREPADSPPCRTVSIGASGPSFLRSRRTQTSTTFERGSKW